ncbi:unnamed protein product [Somion occarium]|uniref:F-box domain-containing protein n=1 Tax=Somion occarium TaxID=3059160 RepID=A0ABP1EBU7_9APHY
MISVLDLPSEVLETIIVSLSDAPLSISALSKSCGRFFSLIYETHDDYLWRRIFLARYDDPRDSDYLNVNAFDKHGWRKEYTSRAFAEDCIARPSLIESPASEKWLGIKREHFPSLIESMLRLCTTASPLSAANSESDSPSSINNVSKAENEKDASLNIRQINKLATGGHFHPLLSWLSPPYRKSAEDAIQAACKLLAFLGPRSTVKCDRWPTSDPFEDSSCALALKYGRRRTYDMDYPERERLFGPFIHHSHHECTPDWIQLAAIRFVCEDAALTEGVQLQLPASDLNRLRPCNWTAQRSLCPTAHNVDNLCKTERDWAGVEGAWRLFVVWLGYDSLIAFNGNMTNDEEVDSGQVHVNVALRLRVVSYEPDPEGSPLFPVIKIEGESGGEGLEAHRVEGNVSMLSDGSVRWSIVSYCLRLSLYSLDDLVSLQRCHLRITLMLRRNGP